jgi:hypothetical protein
MTPDNPTDIVPPVKEPPQNDNIGPGPLPSNDIKEPDRHLNKIAQTPEHPTGRKNVSTWRGNWPGLDPCARTGMDREHVKSTADKPKARLKTRPAR